MVDEMGEESDLGFYDPHDDPRWLGQTAEEEDVREQRRNAEIEAIQRALSEKRGIRELCESPGWAAFTILVDREYARAENALRRVESMENLHRIRGQMIVLEWLLAMPERMAQDVGRLQGELEHATREA